MKLLIDLQAAQSASRHTETGRYALGLAEALARRAGRHEVWVALNGAFPEEIKTLRAAFDSVIPRERIVVWEAPTPVMESDPANLWRQRSGEILRETFLASLNPDIVHVPNLLEGLTDNAIASVGSHTGGDKTAVTLSDLPSLISPDRYVPDQSSRAFYHRKQTSLRRAGLWLAGSESCRREGVGDFDLPPEKVFNVSIAAGKRFCPVDLTEEERKSLRRYGLSRPYVMTVGGLDIHSNLPRLLRAYSTLSNELRMDHQLLILCAKQDEIEILRENATRVGILDEELVILPLVPEDELVILYNLCKVFCQPSLHSSFGLSALEAMQCGTATIGTDLSSVGEIIGWKQALFNPHSHDDIAARLYKVLTDADYRRVLERRGLDRAASFNWDTCANRAWAAFAIHYEQTREAARPQMTRLVSGRPRLAYLSPMPPERSGISDYSSELLPELARHYEIDVIVDQSEVTDDWVEANCPIRDVTWFRQNGQNYDRILYHMGNSPFHQHMFDLLDLHPGVVMLHDFFLSNVIAHLEIHGGWTEFWRKSLYQSHGYSALRDREHSADFTDIMYRYPANFPILRSAQGVIVHSNHSRDLTCKFYGDHSADDWSIVPFLRRTGQTGDRTAVREQLGFEDSDFVLCSFGIMNPTKLNHRLLQAWLDSRLAVDSKCHLVFVGQEDQGEYGTKIRRKIDESPARDRIHITGFTPHNLYRDYLRASDAAVQLRTHSRGETSAAVFDCMAYGLPMIVNAHGSMAELPRECVIMLPDDLTNIQLAAAIENLRADPAHRHALGQQAKEYVKTRLSPRHVAERYHAAIESFAARSKRSLERQAMSKLVSMEPQPQSEQEWIDLARAMSRNLPAPRPQRQLLVDVSANVVTNLKSGIERVVRAQILELLSNPPQGYRVEPVYLVYGADRPHYRYARKYTANLLSLDVNTLEDAPVEVAMGDVFYSPDYYPDGITRAAEQGVYADWRARGVDVTFLVYDLLPTLRPEFFPDFSSEPHTRWLKAIACNADRLICISQAVADELTTWLGQDPKASSEPPPAITALHLGADIVASGASTGIPVDADDVLSRLGTAPSFLMVGTIEPRKGHLQTLAAFEELWREGLDLNLVIVGAEGWKPVPHEQRRTIPEIVQRLRNSPELGKRLFWLEGISDEYLEKLYSISTCLIASSEGEGFGLPLIEAARHNIPILARDIPVFREVAGGHASYFSGAEGADLARAVKVWLKLYARDQHPRSNDMPWLTWAQCAEQLKAILLQETGSKGPRSSMLFSNPVQRVSDRVAEAVST